MRDLLNLQPGPAEHLSLTMDGDETGWHSHEEAKWVMNLLESIGLMHLVTPDRET